MTTNQINYWRNAETTRSNLAQENLTKERDRETQRHNLAMEENAKEIARQGALNLDLMRTAQAETARANQAREAANMMVIAETSRSNLQKEQISRLEAGISQQRLEETARSNKANELLQQFNLAEQVRSHMANENIAIKQAQEIKRHNLELESLQNYSAKTSASTRLLEHFTKSAGEKTKQQSQDFYESTFWPTFWRDTTIQGVNAAANVADSVSSYLKP